MDDKRPKLRFEGFDDAWEQRKLREMATIVRGASPRPIQDPKWFDNKSDIGWLRISDVTEQDGRIYQLDQHISKLGQEKTRVLMEPHLLLSIAATVGKPVVNYVKTGVHDGFLIFLNPSFNQEFMFQWLEMFRPKWQKYGQPGSQVNLNSELVRNQDITLPNDDEQQKIGQFFQLLDQLINLQKRKVVLLEKFKKGYLQLLFPTGDISTPKLRFAEFHYTWESKKFSELYEKVTEKNDLSFNSNKIISVAKMYFKTEKKRVRNEYLKTYNIMRLGDIAFEGNKSKDFSYGRFVENTVGDGIVSHVFEVYRPRDRYDLNFWRYLISYENIMGHILRKSTTKATMMTNLVSKDFLNQNIKVANIEEQIKIGNFLKFIDNSHYIYEQKLHQLTTLKEAYLQKMFI